MVFTFSIINKSEKLELNPDGQEKPSLNIYE